MVSHSAFCTPATANSSTPRGSAAELAFICASRSWLTRLTAKTPLLCTLRMLSLWPPANITCIGVSEMALKNE